MGTPQAHPDPPIGVARQAETIREKLTRSRRKFRLIRGATLCFAVAVLIVLVRDAQILRTDMLPGTLAAYESLAELERTDATFRAFLLTGAASDRQEWENTWQERTTPAIAGVRRSLDAPDSLSAAVEQLKLSQEAWVQSRESGPLSESQAVEALRGLEDSMKNVRLALVNTAQAERNALLGTVSRSTTITVAVMALVILLMVMTFFLSARIVRQISSSVVTPVERLVESATQLAAGNLREDVPVDSNDELGRLAKAINQLRVSLALAEMKYRGLFANTSNSMILLDAQNLTITDANHSFEELMGAKRRRLQERKVLDLFEAEQRPLIEEGLRKAQAHGQHTVSGILMTTPTRLMAVVDVRITSVQVSTEKVVEMTFLDVTEQYVKNQALSEIAFKDELTGLFNHRSFYQAEIRTVFLPADLAA